MKYMSFAITMYLVTAWEFMLSVGIAHIHWWHQLPPIGFTTALIITFLMFSMMTGGSLTTYAFFRGWIK